MTSVSPVKILYDASGNPSGIAEFLSTDNVPVLNGGTGANDVAGAKTNLGFVDLNTPETLYYKTLFSAILVNPTLASGYVYTSANPNTGQAIVWDGTGWVPSALSAIAGGGGGDASSIGGYVVSSPLNPTTGKSLVFSGSVWIASTITGGGGNNPSAITSATNAGVPAGYTLVGPFSAINFTNSSLIFRNIGYSSTNNAPGNNIIVSSVNGAIIISTTSSLYATTLISLGDITLNGSSVSATMGNSRNASAIGGSPVSSTINPTNGQVLAFSSTLWVPSSILFPPSASVIAHSSLDGLANNDHPQYVLSSTNSTLSTNVSNHIADTNNPHATTATQVGNTTAQWNASALRGSPLSATITPANGQFLAFSSTVWIPSSIVFPPSASVIAHSSLAGLANNDHPQYVLSATNSTLSTNVSNHIADTNNPHATTAAQVGNTTAQWNASALRSSPLSATLVPLAGQYLYYNGSVWTASAVAAVAGGSNPSAIISGTNGLIGTGYTAGNIFSGIDFANSSLVFRSLAYSSTNNAPGNNIVITSVSGALVIATTNAHYVTTLTATGDITLNGSSVSAIMGNSRDASSIRLTSISATLVPVAGQVLYYNGSVWTASTLTLGGAGTNPSAITSATNGQIGTGYTVGNIFSGIDFANSSLVLRSIAYSSTNNAPGNNIVITNVSGAWVISTTPAHYVTTLTATGDITLNGSSVSATMGNSRNASAISNIPMSATISPVDGQAIVYSGGVWIVSSAGGTAGPPGTNGTNGASSLQGAYTGGSSISLSTNSPVWLYGSATGNGSLFTVSSLTNGTNKRIIDATSGGVTMEGDLNISGAVAFGTLNDILINGSSVSAIMGNSRNASAIGNVPLSSIFNPVTGQSIVYSGGVWIASTITGGGGPGGGSLQTAYDAGNTIQITDGSPVTFSGNNTGVSLFLVRNGAGELLEVYGSAVKVYDDLMVTGSIQGSSYVECSALSLQEVKYNSFTSAIHTSTIMLYARDCGITGGIDNLVIVRGNNPGNIQKELEIRGFGGGGVIPFLVGAGNNTLNPYNCAAPATSGTLTSNTGNINNKITSLLGTNFATAASVNAVAGFNHTSPAQWLFRRNDTLGSSGDGGGFYFEITFGQTVNAASAVAFFGLAASSTAVALSSTLQVTPSANKYIVGMGYDRLTPSTGNWQFYHASTVPQVGVDLGSSVPRDTSSIFRLKLYSPTQGSSIFVTVENLTRHPPVLAYAAEWSTNIPGGQGATNTLKTNCFLGTNAVLTALSWKLFNCYGETYI